MTLCKKITQVARTIVENFEPIESEALRDVSLTRKEYLSLKELIVEGAVDALSSINFKAGCVYVLTSIMFVIVAFTRPDLSSSSHIRLWMNIYNLIALVAFLLYLSFRGYRTIYKSAIKTLDDIQPLTQTLGEDCFVLRLYTLRASWIIQMVFKVFFRGELVFIFNLNTKQLLLEQSKVRAILKSIPVYVDDEEL